MRIGRVDDFSADISLVSEPSKCSARHRVSRESLSCFNNLVMQPDSSDSRETLKCGFAIRHRNKAVAFHVKQL